MSEQGGSLNTLLKYRFTKKPMPKINHTDQQNGSILREASIGSTDSQATIPYLSSQNSVGSNDSDATIIAKPSLNNGSVLGSPKADSQASNDIESSTASPSSNVNSTSPVFKSKLSNSLHKNQNDDSPSTSHTLSPGGPWISKVTGAASPSSKSNQASRFKRIKRPDTDSDDEDNADENNGITVDKHQLKRLKEVFPNGDVKRMKAGLFVYPNDFERAVQFVKSEPAAGDKRSLSLSMQDDSDELPEITGSRKRIKVMPESPSPTKEGSKPNFSSGAQEKTIDEKVSFLKGCFPAKTNEHIRSVVEANDGNTEKSAIALVSENGPDAKLAESMSEAPPGPSSKDASKPTKTASTLSGKIPNGKSTAKKKNYDMSDDEDEEEFDEDYESGDSMDSEDLGHRTKTESDEFLLFFEDATVEELVSLPGCSKKKAELIVTLRPFSSWDNLIEKFEEEKTLSTGLISGCKEVMQVRNTIKRLMYRCENISQRMGKVVSGLSAQSNDVGEDISNHDDINITKQPELLNKEYTLKPYQLIGLSWLRIMDEQEVNGILADEMGLGKTIQAISFMAHLLEEGEDGPHVIIVPSSTIENWLRELQRWCPALKVLVYYGSQEERRCVRHSVILDGEEFNVLLTTYNMATGGAEDRILFKKYNFHYAIFDEGHMLKNMSSLRFQNLMRISAERRLLLTGTPLQNNLLELMSLLCFVMPDIFQGKTEPLKKMFTMITRTEDKQKSRFQQSRIAQAKRIMKPFVLRRLKKDVLQQLPKKCERIVTCTMVPCQQELYDRLVNRYADDVAQGVAAEESSGGIGLFMQLRKAANHPLLLRHRYTDDLLEQMAKKIAKEPSHRDRGALPKLIQEDMAVMNDFELTALCKQYKKYLGKFELDPSVMDDSGKFRQLDEHLPEMKGKGDRVLLFSQFTMMLDVVEHYLNRKGYKFIRLDGQTPVPDRLQLIDRFNNEPEIFIFLLSTRAGGIGINLTAANTIIIHDIDFNPYNDKQAEDRCHRLGQTREVTVLKLICEDTVDEGMLKCAKDKLALEKDVTGSGHEEESEDSGKDDVANLLKEVLKQTQKKREAALAKSAKS